MAISDDDDRPEGATSSRVSGGAGDVVQARDVSGGIHFHYSTGAASSAPQQLPRGVRVFVNRVADLAALDEVLASRVDERDPAVVYVVAGTAGVGKTSLVLHWAHRVSAGFPGGQLYVDMRGYDPGDPVTAEVALERFLLALGVAPGSVPADLDTRSGLFRSILAERRVLVLIDNAATVGQVRPLLPGSGGSVAVVTSRSRLAGLAVRDGAQQATLDVLTEAESVELLTETMARFRPGDDPGEVAELARLCACLPLALRIAAERAASRPGMPLGELIEDLRDQSELWGALSAGDEEDVDAVRTVFAWSFRALPVEAARLFCLLGMHPGGEFSYPAVVALAGGEVGRVRSALDVLVGAHLLERTGHARFKFHDLLRAYAIDRASYETPRAEQLVAVERVCGWYRVSAERCAAWVAHDMTLLEVSDRVPAGPPMDFPDRAAADRWYREERSNLVGAVRAAAGTGQDLLAWELAAVLERLYASFNHFEDWRGTSTIGIEAARRLAAPGREAVMQESLGRLHRLSLRLDEAAARYEAAIDSYRLTGSRLEEVKCLNGLAWVHLFGHRVTDAERVLLDALATARGLGDEYWTATVLYSLGYTRLQLDRPEEAEPVLAESLAVFEGLADRFYVSMVLTARSFLHRVRGDTTEASDDAACAVEIARAVGNRLWEGTALLYLGKAQCAVGDPAEALVSFQHAAAQFRDEGDLSREAMAVTYTGRAYAQLGRPDDAASFYRWATGVQRQLGDDWKLARCLEGLAECVPDADQARQCRSEAARLLEGFDDPKSIRIRARLSQALGQ